jgi:hypothetical protein
VGDNGAGHESLSERGSEFSVLKLEFVVAMESVLRDDDELEEELASSTAGQRRLGLCIARIVPEPDGATSVDDGGAVDDDEMAATPVPAFVFGNA